MQPNVKDAVKASAEALKNGMENVTRAAAIDATKNTTILANLLANPTAKLDWADRKVLLWSIHNLNNGGVASKILKAASKAAGRVITRAEARKTIEARLNAKTAQQAIKSDEAVKKAAIEKGLWNMGINYVTTSGSTENAPGANGNKQNNSIGDTPLLENKGGSFLGG